MGQRRARSRGARSRGRAALAGGGEACRVRPRRERPIPFGVGLGGFVLLVRRIVVVLLPVFVVVVARERRSLVAARLRISLRLARGVSCTLVGLTASSRPLRHRRRLLDTRRLRRDEPSVTPVSSLRLGSPDEARHLAVRGAGVRSLVPSVGQRLLPTENPCAPVGPPRGTSPAREVLLVAPAFSCPSSWPHYLCVAAAARRATRLARHATVAAGPSTSLSPPRATGGSMILGSEPSKPGGSLAGTRASGVEAAGPASRRASSIGCLWTRPRASATAPGGLRREATGAARGRCVPRSASALVNAGGVVAPRTGRESRRRRCCFLEMPLLQRSSSGVPTGAAPCGGRRRRGAGRQGCRGRPGRWKPSRPPALRATAVAASESTTAPCPRGGQRARLVGRSVGTPGARVPPSPAPGRVWPSRRHGKCATPRAKERTAVGYTPVAIRHSRTTTARRRLWDSAIRDVGLGHSEEEDHTISPSTM